MTALLVIAVFSGEAYADQTIDTSIAYDKSSVPPEYMMPVLQTTLPYSPYTIIVCGSESNAQNGACPTRSAAGGPPMIAPSLANGGVITLTFTKEGTSETKNVILKAYRKNVCSFRFPWDGNGCAATADPPMILYVGIQNDALSTLTPGNWKGSLKMYQRTPDSATTVATYTYNITLKVTDTQKQTIYFPAFPGGSPLIDLNLNYRPGAKGSGQISGKTELDMCLYDGGLSANRISLIFQDGGGEPSGREPGLYSIYKNGGNTNEDNRVDYLVQVKNPVTGNLDTVKNGVPVNWNNVNVPHIKRQVVLPGIPGVSLCIPAPLTLSTNTVNKKSAGHYTGTLTIIYTPYTQQ